MELVFGPVPSRRLGRSLGINNIPPPKRCSYSCIYCQLGRTEELTIERRRFHDPGSIAEAVSSKVSEVGDRIDYITFVPDGEPTLDELLGEEVKLIREVADKPLAILTNSSLIFRSDVRADLLGFDLVSLKVDAASEKVWRKVNRPHPSLSLAEILKGVKVFARDFSGKLIVETMLIDGVNAASSELDSIASFLGEVEPSKAYLAIPTRPPAESWVKPASEEKLVESYEIFREHIGAERVELLTGYEGPEFHLGRDPIKDLLAIASIHPIRIDYAYRVLSEHGEDPEKALRRLVEGGELKLAEYRGKRFLIRSFRR